jgi:hypothetical protein
MKKKLLLFVMCLFAYAGNMMAQEVAPSVGDIYYKVDKTDIMQGKTAGITFYYDAAEDAIFKGFQVEFILPEGFKMAPGATLGAELAAHNPEMDLKTSERLDPGNELPTCVYMGVQIDLAEMPVGEGIELFTFYVEAAEDVAPGEYPFTTTHLELADMKTGQSKHCEAKTHTLNAIPYAARILADDDTNIPSASDLPEDVIVKRTIKANVWSTLTLPFDMPADQVAEAFGDDLQVATLSELWDSEDGYPLIYFETADIANTGLKKNYPYLIKSSKALDEFKAVDVMVDPDEANAKETYTARKKDWVTMYGTLHAGVEVPRNDLFLRDNMFFVSSGESKINAFRAYFNLLDYEYDFEGGAANVSFVVDGEPTNIEGVGINGREYVNGDVYSVNGTYMGRAEDVMNKLPRGIYIVNNKKVVVK